MYEIVRVRKKEEHRMRRELGGSGRSSWREKNTLYENLILKEREKGGKETGGFNPMLSE